jgi:hypothetical protein
MGNSWASSWHRSIRTAWRGSDAAAEIERTIASGEPSAQVLADLLDLLRSSVARLAEWEAAQQVAMAGAT